MGRGAVHDDAALQLPESAFAALCDESIGWCTLDGFIGEGWAEAVYDDISRFAEGGKCVLCGVGGERRGGGGRGDHCLHVLAGRLQRPIADQGSMAWIEPRDVTDEYARRSCATSFAA